MEPCNISRKSDKYSLATLNLALNILGFVQLHPVKTPKKKMFLFASCFYTVTFLHYYLIYLQMFHIGEDISLLSRTVASFSTYTQAILKMLPIIYYREHIRSLLNKRKYFWKNDSGELVDIQGIEELHKNGYIFGRVFSGLVALTAITYFLKPLFNKELFIVVWVPNYPYAFEILLVGQYIYCPLLSCMIIGTDILFVSLCLDMIVQFKILGLNIQTTRNVNGLKRCIQQHVFLLKYVNDIQTLFRMPLFGEYLITIGSTCMELYTLTDPSSSINNKMISFMYSCSLLFQFGLFCFPASSLSDSITSISNDFYFSKWEDASESMREGVCFSIMRAQKEFSLKAGGMLDINKEAFTNVFKTAFSFLTLMRSFQE